MSRDKLPARFVMTGFTQAGESRRFAFDRVDANNSRTRFTVRADLTLTRRYGIHMQELPLLCCELLEESPDLEKRADLTFSEDLMRRHKADRVAAAQQKYRVPKRVPTGAAVSSWRGARRP